MSMEGHDVLPPNAVALFARAKRTPNQKCLQVCTMLKLIKTLALGSL